VETSYTPVFIGGKEDAEKHGIQYKRSLKYALIYKEEPDIVIAHAKGHTFYTEDGVTVAPGMDSFNVHFKNDRVKSDTIFAHNSESAIFLLQSMYNLDLVESLEQEKITRTIVWYDGNACT